MPEMSKKTPPQDALVELGTGVHLDVQTLIDSKLLVQANSGGGKSYAVRKLCEITYGHAQQIILDVEGEFYTLREKHDYVLFGGGGDYPVSVETAPVIARRLLELGVSAVIDIYELGAKRGQFIAAFLATIMAAPRAQWHDMIIVVDEANKFCPEDAKEKWADKLPDELSKRLGLPKDLTASDAIVDLMTRGRKRGFGVVLATQRLSSLNKNAAAECNNLMIGRCALDVDIDRAAKRIGMKTTEAHQALPAMPAGVFYASGPAFHIDDGIPNRVARIQVGYVVTTHPRRGQKPPVPPPAATVRKLLAGLADLQAAADAESSELEKLRNANYELTKQLVALGKTKDTRVAQANESAAIQYREAWESAHEELEDTRQRIFALGRLFRADGKGVNLDTLEEDVAGAVAQRDRLMNQLMSAVTKIREIEADLMKQPPIEVKAKAKPAPNGRSKPVTPPAPPPKGLAAKHGVNWYSPAHQRVLDTIALIEKLAIEPQIETIAAWYGQHPQSKGFRNYISKLRRLGLLEKGSPITASHVFYPERA